LTLPHWYDRLRVKRIPEQDEVMEESFSLVDHQDNANPLEAECIVGADREEIRSQRVGTVAVVERVARPIQDICH
jgi:hypothetical protein